LKSIPVNMEGQDNKAVEADVLLVCDRAQIL
jgi:hypothetical protein